MFIRFEKSGLQPIFTRQLGMNGLCARAAEWTMITKRYMKTRITFWIERFAFLTAFRAALTLPYRGNGIYKQGEVEGKGKKRRGVEHSTGHPLIWVISGTRLQTRTSPVWLKKVLRKGTGWKLVLLFIVCEPMALSVGLSAYSILIVGFKTGRPRIQFWRCGNELRNSYSRNTLSWKQTQRKDKELVHSHT